jgi:hypothetical protein
MKIVPIYKDGKPLTAYNEICYRVQDGPHKSRLGTIGELTRDISYSGKIEIDKNHRYNLDVAETETVNDINISHANYPHVSSYVAAWKKLNDIFRNDPNTLVVLDRHYGEITADQARKDFIKALHNRINFRGGDRVRGKKDCYDYYWRLMRDKMALNNLRNRICVYGFETREVRERFSHLLSRYDD